MFSCITTECYQIQTDSFQEYPSLLRKFWFLVQVIPLLQSTRIAPHLPIIEQLWMQNQHRQQNQKTCTAHLPVHLTKSNSLNLIFQRLCLPLALLIDIVLPHNLKVIILRAPLAFQPKIVPPHNQLITQSLPTRRLLICTALPPCYLLRCSVGYWINPDHLYSLTKLRPQTEPYGCTINPKVYLR
jgi:hypothetical protein